MGDGKIVVIERSHIDFIKNGDWYVWSESQNGNAKGDYIKAWQHVHTIFQNVGATNVNWVWCVNVGIFPLSEWYPGDSYVDWVAADGYNWGGNASFGHTWQSFQSVFNSTITQLAALTSKPIAITEVASDESGGSKVRVGNEGDLTCHSFRQTGSLTCTPLNFQITILK
jgi:beta-mannanase